MRRRARNSSARSRNGRRCTTDRDAQFDREVKLDAGDIAPIVTWGTSPEDALPIDASVPDPAREPDAARAKYLRERARIHGHRARHEAHRHRGRSRVHRLLHQLPASRICARPPRCSPAARARCRAWFRPARRWSSVRPKRKGSTASSSTPASNGAKSGCSMCVGINGDIVPPGERCASTTNRNFRGRQGPGARTHLMSPAMVAAAAVTGHLADVRPLLAGTEGVTRMDKFTQARRAAACPSTSTNLNTDQILPARYLKCAARDGHRQGAVPGSALRCRGQARGRISRSTAGLARRQDRRRRAATSAAARRARRRSMRSTITASAA